MKTSRYRRKYFALVLGPISALVLTGTLSSSLASAEPYASQTSTSVGEYGTGAEVPVPPWCSWYSSIQEDVLLAPVDDPNGDITYRGDAVDLAFNSNLNYTYVGGAAGLIEKPLSNNCSWFGDPAYGSRLDVEINRNNFVAYVVNGATWIPDTVMDFNLSEENPFTLIRDVDASCADPGNTFSTPELVTNLYQESTPVTGLSVVPGASTVTNNFCKWKVNYAVTLPAGLEPSYTLADYAWIGPQLIYTLSFPVE